jgi:transcription elongation factor GreA
VYPADSTSYAGLATRGDLDKTRIALGTKLPRSAFFCSGWDEMEDETIALTPEGRAKLQAELKHLREERRPQVVQRLHTAREDSEAWDNPEIIEAKNDLSFVDGRIQEIERTLSKASSIPQVKTPGLVTLGSRVTLHNEETSEDEIYTIVGSAEAQPREGRISDRSPVGRAVLGHRVGDTVQVETPAGPLELVIAKVE